MYKVNKVTYEENECQYEKRLWKGCKAFKAGTRRNNIKKSAMQLNGARE